MKRAIKAIIITIVIAYMILMSAAGVFCAEPKGVSAWQEWCGEGGWWVQGIV